MSNKDKFYFVSIEGNWDKSIHDRRIARAAKILQKNETSFAIASGTYAPPEYSSFCEEKLGAYTKTSLMNDYGIPGMRILPAYLFPYKSTYTIIDAFTNAVLIGWVSCGLKKSDAMVNILFESNTSAFHGVRVELLNKRACQYLDALNVNVELLSKNKLSCETLKEEYPKEFMRVSALQTKEGIVNTGEWSDNGHIRSYDNLQMMRLDLMQAFNSVFANLFLFDNLDKLCDAGRLIFTLSWNQIANSKKMDKQDFDEICSYVLSNFYCETTDSVMLDIKRMVDIFI